jgi:hypothetical protein
VGSEGIGSKGSKGVARIDSKGGKEVVSSEGVGREGSKRVARRGREGGSEEGMEVRVAQTLPYPTARIVADEAASG